MFCLKRQVTIIVATSLHLTIFMVIYKPKSCPEPTVDTVLPAHQVLLLLQLFNLLLNLSLIDSESNVSVFHFLRSYAYFIDSYPLILQASSFHFLDQSFQLIS
jgi:hypothetical protein